MTAYEPPFEEALVRPYVLHHANATPFAAPPGPVPTRERLDQRPRVVLIAWGADQAHVMCAIHRARERALDDELAIVNWFAAYGLPMRKAPFTALADRFSRRREIDYDFAWWLVADWVIPAGELAAAQARQREQRSAEPDPEPSEDPCGPSALRPVRVVPPEAAS
ncbi:hypothetical protein LO772_10610 [Yinghuangia sp. ASG 101]|uniref:hypothetical protein n=1 Tax=Yinghuangia sp. ASG 101 TaxID=2896848 RepID=UPI001E4ABBE2|nr:hypothetical protein [Yinghuangia sp. ASG 101]UGQ14006.1 hypothetical protein LO772_10610 [Yinghuangia sp. ASG 101]